MHKNLEVGMKIKQVKVIEKYGFDYVGTEFEVTKVAEDVILFKGSLGQGGISKDEFDEYFEIVEEVQENTVKSYKLGDKVKIINGIFKGIEGGSSRK